MMVAAPLSCEPGALALLVVGRASNLVLLVVGRALDVAGCGVAVRLSYADLVVVRVAPRVAAAPLSRWRSPVSRKPRTVVPTAQDGCSERLLTVHEVAERIGVSVKTLQNAASTWEVDRWGPEPHQIYPGRGGRRYAESEVNRIVADTLAGRQPLARNLKGKHCA
ncbi:hypothetical protein P3T37_004335 [Kitasatospora sp. MAA4]|uniref:helix-turn-helix transcriptional regulator n=1 Tax=Kitasatospora sp. MAA4 TaxID=3035093 RepID=UPI0024743355|nr:hypothetical protein [Kitasatospora sp. MAA4]MDH6134926.1 hypothetical protein [Kitasatospora sp. MAA4]